MRRQGRRDGFTLIEMLAAVFLTSVVVSVAVGSYINLSRAMEGASLRLRAVRHAATVMDRVARDLESTMLLVKPNAIDPLDHPWLFLAESRHALDGADHFKFVSQRHPSRMQSGSESHVEMVSYVLNPVDADLYDLIRVSSPRLPEGLDREFPSGDAEGARVLARNLTSFSLRFLNPAGEWVDEWDSSTLALSGQLPLEIEIQVELAERIEDDPSQEVRRSYSRRLVLPMRPIDVEAQIRRALDLQAQGSGEGGCVTMSECLTRPQNRALWQQYFDQCATDLAACARVEKTGDQCYTPDKLPGAVGCGR